MKKLLRNRTSITTPAFVGAFGTTSAWPPSLKANGKLSYKRVGLPRRSSVALAKERRWGVVSETS